MAINSKDGLIPIMPKQYPLAETRFPLVSTGTLKSVGTMFFTNYSTHRPYNLEIVVRADLVPLSLKRDTSPDVLPTSREQVLYNSCEFRRPSGGLPSLLRSPGATSPSSGSPGVSLHCSLPAASLTADAASLVEPALPACLRVRGSFEEGLHDWDTAEASGAASCLPDVPATRRSSIPDVITRTSADCTGLVDPAWCTTPLIPDPRKHPPGMSPGLSCLLCPCWQ